MYRWILLHRYPMNSPLRPHCRINYSRVTEILSILQKCLRDVMEHGRFAHKKEWNGILIDFFIHYFHDEDVNQPHERSDSTLIRIKLFTWIKTTEFYPFDKVHLLSSTNKTGNDNRKMDTTTKWIWTQRIVALVQLGQASYNEVAVHLNTRTDERVVDFSRWSLVPSKPQQMWLFTTELF